MMNEINTPGQPPNEIAPAGPAPVGGIYPAAPPPALNPLPAATTW